MNPIKELKKIKLNFAQRVLNVFLQGAFYVLILILVSQIIQSEVFSALENNKEKIAGEITDLVLEKQVQDLNLDLNEAQIEEGKSILKKEIASQINETLSIVKRNLQENVSKFTNIFSQDKVILILGILLLLIFLNNGLLLTTHFLSKNILEIGIILITPKIIIQIVLNKKFITWLSSLITIEIDQATQAKVIELISQIFNQVFQKYFISGLIMIIAAILLQFGIKAIAKRKIENLKQTEVQN